MYRSLSLLLALAMAGCASTQDSPPAVTLPDLQPPRSCTDLLGFYEAASLMPGKERLRQKQQLSTWLKLTGHPCDRLRLALLLATPLGSIEDKRRAVRLLEKVLASEGMEPEELRLAGLLRDQLQQQIWALAQSARLKRQLEETRQTAETLQQENTHLESLLERLKTIERNFNEQEQAIITPATPSPANGKGKNPAGRR
ncbi:MAG: hypothetical protein DSZ00_04310 [Gammaproteobacteria bacterium]|nr:MAG: hypothetical protein DSZ02_05650 [Gammaproteobacteria bacterium]RTZ74422.1 MAG: hypothetical protein DSZ00_04310 [Gammaproteobacteria bacterium]RTZ79899.1 MAG: hypothetical protein DSZ01_02985 [Gammaproteobacteria bacterium]